MTLISVIAQSVSYQAFAGAISGVVTLFGGVIALLYRRVERDAQKCIEDRATDQKERAAENKTWADRFDVLHRERAAENRVWFEKIDMLHKEHEAKTEKMLDQVVAIVKQGKDVEYATIHAITDSSKTMLHVRESLQLLSQKIHENPT